jgi:uncharacterized protein YidB (DUF937 family)
MGLLDSVIGALGQSQGGGGGTGGMGGGTQAALLQAVIAMLTQGGGAQAGGAQAAPGGGLGGMLGGVLGGALGGGGGGSGGGGLGGLGGLLEQFTRHGMGDAVQSWVGTGQNMPVSPDQITQVFGNDAIGKLAQQLGLGHGEVAGQLSQMLPQVVDKLTPHGQVPQGNDLSALGDIGGLLGGLMHR